MIGNHIAVIEQRAPFAPMGKQTVPIALYLSQRGPSIMLICFNEQQEV